jgi:HAD superfamily 5'-nucleotidase-like hydrolase
MVNSFDFASYDCIGFDLDNTLAEYNEQELINLIYEIIANCMVNNYNYNPNDLLKPVTDDIDFIRKGLTLDIERGNIVSLADDGTVLRASYGTRLLSAAEIKDIYGSDRAWNVGIQHCNDFLTTWNGQLSEKIRSSLDYFDMCVPLIFARSIDSLAGHQSVTAYNVWMHIFNSLCSMFKKENYKDNCGGYYDTLKQNPDKYIKKRSPEFLNWIISLKKANKTTFLITGSDYDYGEFIARNALGPDWEKHFDIVVYYARKPGFFSQNREFKVAGPQETVVSPEKLEFGQSYREGNWTDLHQLFTKSLNKVPKCLYIGDNLIQDVYAPAKFKCCDTVAVVKELTKFDRRIDEELFLSNTWGSIFYDKLNSKSTIWDKVVNNYSKLYVPSLDWFLNKNH